MSHEISGSHSEHLKKSASKPPISAQEVADIDTAKAIAQSDREQAESPEKHKSELASLVMDHWKEDGNKTTCFGVEVQPDMVPNKVVDCLVRIETDYELDLVASLENDELSPEDVGDFLAGEIKHSINEKKLQAKKSEAKDAAEKLAEEKSETAEQKSETDETVEKAKSYISKGEALKREGNSTAEVIEALADDPATPEAEKAKLQAFKHIFALAQTPQDRQVISQKVNNLNFARLPDPVAFIQHQIFDHGEQKSGVSEATQNHIAKAFGSR